MDSVARGKPTSEISYVDRILKEEMEREPTQIINNVSPSAGSNSMIPPHRYRFQQLKSYNSKITKNDANKESNGSSSTVKPTDPSSDDQTPQHRPVKTRSIWCGGPFFCVPKKNKPHLKKPTKIGSTNDPLLSAADMDDTFATHKSSKLIDEAVDIQHGSKQNKHSITDGADKKLLAKSLDEKSLQIVTLLQQIERFKNENNKLLEEYNKLKVSSAQLQTHLNDETKQQHSNQVKKLEDRIQTANESIKKYVADLDEHKQTITALEEKLKMSTLTEDLMFKKKLKDSQKIKELKAKHENEISELQTQIEMLRSKIDEQSSIYSSSYQKLSSVFDSCKNFNDENTELHGDLEYTINMIESFLVGYQEESESLKQQSTKNNEIIDNLENRLKEKSSLIDEITNLFGEFSLEKPESSNSHWIQCFREKLRKVNDDSNHYSKKDYPTLESKTNVESIDDQGVKHVVSPFVDEILEKLNNLENLDDTQDQISLTVASSSNEEITPKKSFELEAVSVEKISKLSSQTDQDQI